MKVCSALSEEIYADCKKWAQTIMGEYRPDLIVFLAKSGFLFARPLAEVFNCPMEGIVASRPTNIAKDTIKKIFPWIPKELLYLALKSKALYANHEENKERNIEFLPGLEDFDFSTIQRILVVDDSVDTGWSLVAALDALRAIAPHCELKTAGYCVIDLSAKRVAVDFYRYKNTIVVTATSRYSKEYSNFIFEYESWLRAH